jgi:hypothetical protein
VLISSSGIVYRAFPYQRMFDVPALDDIDNLLRVIADD